MESGASRVEAKDKLSQNRPIADREQVVADLLKSGDYQAHLVAEEMRKHF